MMLTDRYLIFVLVRVKCCIVGCIVLLVDSLLADLQSTTTSLRQPLTANGSCASDSHSMMASRISTDSVDAEGQVIVTSQAYLGIFGRTLFCSRLQFLSPSQLVM